MNLWYAKAAVLASLLSFIFIRWPHGNRYGKAKIIDDRKGGLEIALLSSAGIGTTLLPLIWILFGWPSAADYPLYSIAYGFGLLFMGWGLWLFHRSHTDLGLNWSVTLQMRDEHHLVTSGVYAKIRHPMYSSMFLLGIAQLLLLPNWIIGPAYLVSFGLLYLLRVNAEERMVQDRFGAEYDEYVNRTGRLIPRLRSRV